MLRKYSSSRSLKDNIKLGVLTAYCAGMVNVISVIIFFAFTSNVTGHYAVLAEELSKGNWYQAGVVAVWIMLFCFGGFISNLIIINLGRRNSYLTHGIPILLEMVCLIITGSYIQFYYHETLVETEFLVGLMLFAMGLQNGLTASISNSAVKTTHLTGLTTDLGMLLSMFTQRRFRKKKQLVEKAKIQVSIMLAYVTGGVAAGLIYNTVAYNVFYITCGFLLLVLLYDYYRITVVKFVFRRRQSPRYSYVYSEKNDNT
ncbi:DUF1275 domain-containing protein [Fulvivirga maritima]|uniref:YoaK family protein n=1 Tax=Fulvivirga maritima TaxID=2904247 RepID=UPI001F242B3A|nr:YoaK family protein [Fulvivirga maritima]UII26227.1 DUF1275 domain-containing protein [Fulvivirga maritima]